MSISNQELFELLKGKFQDAIEPDGDSLDLLGIVVDKDRCHDLIQYLRDEPSLSFNFLTDVCGVHFADNEAAKQFAVVYHLHCWKDNLRIRVKAFLPSGNPEIESVVDLFLSANWQERETYDFYGIEFKNHPDLRRILNMDEMVSFPMRKEYPMEDGSRTDKDDRYFGRLPQTNNVVIN